MNHFKLSAQTQRQSALQAGFTLLELLVVIAIIGVLASMAVPTFQNKVKKAKFVEVINAAGPFKTAVEVCVQKGRTLEDCGAGKPGIPADVGASTGNKAIASVGVGNSGVITATGGTDVGGKTYVLTPSIPSETAGTATLSSTGLSWAITGTCVGADLCEK